MIIALKCVKSGGYFITPGRIYHCFICKDTPSAFFPDKQVFDYYIVNDKGVGHGIEGNLFVRVDEVRMEKLKQLGI